MFAGVQQIDQTWLLRAPSERSIDSHRAGVGFENARGDIHERRLTRAVLTDDRDGLAALNREVGSSQHRFRAKLFRDPDRLQHGHHRTATRRRRESRLPQGRAPSRLSAVLHYAVEAAFDDLLCRWRAYEDVKTHENSTFRALGDARTALDHARDRMHSLRIAMYPANHELESIVDSLWCETLDMVVHLRRDDRDPESPANFRCACGHLVTIDAARVTY